MYVLTCCPDITVLSGGGWVSFGVDKTILYLVIKPTLSFYRPLKSYLETWKWVWMPPPYQFPFDSLAKSMAKVSGHIHGTSGKAKAPVITRIAVTNIQQYFIYTKNVQYMHYLNTQHYNLLFMQIYNN